MAMLFGGVSTWRLLLVVALAASGASCSDSDDTTKTPLETAEPSGAASPSATPAGPATQASPTGSQSSAAPSTSAPVLTPPAGTSAGSAGAPSDLPGAGGAPHAGAGGMNGVGGFGGRGGAVGSAGGSAGVDGDGAGGTLNGAGGSAGALNGAGGTIAGSGGESGSGGATTTPPEIDPDALYVAPDGAAAGSGSSDDPTTLSDAVGRVNAGQTIYLRGGNYVLSSSINLNANGSSDAPITLRAYPLDEQRPRLDFSSMAENSSNRGVVLSGDNWHVYGIDIWQAGDNCMFVSGSNNVIEFSTFSECSDTGLQLGNGAANNLVLNCDSFFNADSSLENADGFAAKLDVGTGNRFVGCRAWNNLDDGWDGYLRPADDVTTTHENCWAIDNGKLKDGSVGAGDGNGFKTGGSDDKDLRHHATYTGCIAAGNVNDGFDHNSNRGEVTILNSAAQGNGSNINFGSSNIAASLTIKNTIAVGSNGSLNATVTDITHNSWQDGRAATADDFVSLDMSALKAPRKPDGSLPDIDTLKLTPSSDLRNAGVDLGLPFNGSAPDLGPFESDE